MHYVYHPVNGKKLVETEQYFEHLKSGWYDTPAKFPPKVELKKEEEKENEPEKNDAAKNQDAEKTRGKRQRGPEGLLNDSNSG